GTTWGTCTEGTCVASDCVDSFAEHGIFPGCATQAVLRSGVCKLFILKGSTCYPSSDPCRYSTGICNAKGACVAQPTVGQPCKPPGQVLGPCQAGVCSSKAACEVVPVPGKACALPESATSDCVTGVCSADGTCAATAVVGKSCFVGDHCSPGECDSAGICIAKPLPDGSYCYAKGWKGTCQSGKCAIDSKCIPESYAATENPCLVMGKDATGACSPVVKTGAPCTAPWDPGICHSKAGTCDSKGFCVGSVVVGAPCSVGECTKGLCTAQGTCAWTFDVGATCGLGDTTCASHTCDAKGVCVATPKVGKKCGESGKPCVEMQCAPTGTCEPVNLPSTATCAFDAPCMTAAGHCNGAGNCTGQPTPGADCTAFLPAFDNACRKATCSATGQCISEVTPGAACSTPCMTGGTCDAQGNCQGTPVVQGNTKEWKCLTPCGGEGKCQSDGRCHALKKSLDTVGAAYLCRSSSCNIEGLQEVKSMAPDGTPCAEGCISSGQCIRGYCIGHVVPEGCEDGNVCTHNYCCGGLAKGAPDLAKFDSYNTFCFWGWTPYSCFNTNLSTSCGPTDACGMTPSCSGGSCIGPPTTCYPEEHYPCSGCEWGPETWGCATKVCSEKGCVKVPMETTYLNTSAGCGGNFVCKDMQCILK
ncbi:MAG: hypothetical protein HY902_05005, partial [Deltaproteobacteria bacterium]|nr:hypothetical protein [Deltaproteobacteria bacterium]